MKPALFFILYIIIPNPVESQEANDAKALRVQIFETDAYDKKIRPATNQSDSTGNVLDRLLIKGTQQVMCFHRLPFKATQQVMY